MKKLGKTLAIIPARGGSKGLPRKNVLIAGGRPLIAWTIAAASAARSVDQVIVSSDDDEIIETSEAWGCPVPFHRPESLATDNATSIDVVFHALDQMPGFEYVILLQPTSPLRTASDIDAAVNLLLTTGAPSCVSICEAEQSPYWMYFLDDNRGLDQVIPGKASITRRQDLPTSYVLNGAIYVAEVEWLKRERRFVAPDTVGYVMGKDRSIDIDTREDFDALCLYFSRQQTDC